MYLLEAKNAYATEEPCHDKQSMYAIDDDGALLCVTERECVGRNGFLDGSQCLTAAQCQLMGAHFAYTATGTCVSSGPADLSGFDEGKRDKGVYDCAGKYLDLRTFSCVGDTSCTRTNGAGHRMLLSRSQGLCLGEDQRYAYDCYIYGFGSQRECVPARECK